MLKRFNSYTTNEIVLADNDPSPADVPAGVYSRVQKRKWKLWFNRSNDTYFIRTDIRNNTWTGPFNSNPFSAFFVRDGGLAGGQWVRLSEDIVDSVNQPFVVPFTGVVKRLTFSSRTFTGISYQIEIYRNAVLIVTQPLVSGVLRQSFDINLPVSSTDLISIFIRRTAGVGNIIDPVVQIYS